MLNVKDYGAQGDGISDDTISVQSAVAAASVSGTKLYFPAGVYRLTNQVVFDKSINVCGDGWQDVRDVTGPTTRDWSQRQARGSIIYMDFTDSVAASCFYVNGNSVSIEGVEFEDNQGVPAPGWTPATNRPWAIEVYRAPYHENGGNTCRIKNVMLRNCYKGIRLTGVSRAFIDEIYGQPLRYGIVVDSAYDVVRVSNIHLGWSYWSGSAEVTNYLLSNFEALVIGRCDNPTIHNFFVFTANTGIRFYSNQIANPPGVASRSQLSNAGLDNVVTGIKITDAAEVAVSNLYIYCASVTGSRGIWTTPVLEGAYEGVALQLANIDITGANYEALRLECDGYARITNMTIRSYNQSASGKAAIMAADAVSVELGGGCQFGGGAGGPLFATTGGGVVRGSYSGQGNDVHSTKTVVGTVNAANEVVFAHGISPSRLLSAQCVYRAVDGSAKPMAMEFASATDLKFSGGVSGQPYKCCVIFSPQDVTGW